MKQGFKDILSQMDQGKAAEYINNIVSQTKSNHPLAEYIRSELAEACAELRKEAQE